MDKSLQDTLKKYGQAKTKQAVSNVKSSIKSNIVQPIQQTGQNIARGIASEISSTLQPAKTIGALGAASAAGSAAAQRDLATKVGQMAGTVKPTTTPSTGTSAAAIGSAGAAIGAAQPKSTGKTDEQIFQENLRKEIQNAYNAQLNFLTAQEKALQGQFPGQLEQLGAQYEALRPELQAQLQAQQEAGTIAQEDIRAAEQANIAAIRRGAEEQGIRAVQQFGGVGGSSAAQAAGELLAREQLRSQGAARMQAAQNIQSVQQQLRTIQAEYDSNVNKLNLEKERALQTARNEFNRQLESIRKSRMEAGVTKASQTISALQSFADRRRTIEDQATTLQNNLTLLKSQAENQANLLRLQSSLATPTTTPVSFAGLFQGASADQKLSQSNEAAKLLQSIINTGNLTKYGITDLGSDPVTGERLFQTDAGIMDIKGNLRTGTGQFQQQNPSWWSSLFQQ